MSYAQLTNDANQVYGDADTPKDIEYNTQNGLSGISHSESVDPENIVITESGRYFILVQPQVQNTGGTKEEFYAWLAKNTGAGFADIPDTNTELSLGSNETAVQILGWIADFQSGDIVKVVSGVSSTNVRLLAVASPPVGPAIPSVICTVFKTGNC